jgi:Spy/CpxP family protein refolding chaperone
MKRTLLVLTLGMVAGVAAHLGWFQLRQPCGGDQLECQLAWMKTELKLTDEQFARIHALHEASSPQLTALAARVARMRNEYAAFEQARLTTDQVDFVEFARFVEAQRAVDYECLASSRQLVAAASGILTPIQRERYLGLLPPALAVGVPKPQ